MNNKTIYCYNATPTPRNPFIIFLGFGDLCGRTIKNKGAYGSPFASRPMVQYELENMERAWREHFCRYKDWQGFITDEWLVTKDLAWCRQLYEISKLQTPLEDLLEGYQAPSEDPPAADGIISPADLQAWADKFFHQNQ